MKGIKDKMLKVIQNTKFGQRMFLIYLIGGLLPMILIGIYLIHGTTEILVRQAESSELEELKTVKTHLLETQNIMASVSEYFYLDEQLEEIAWKQYTDYQEIIDAYKGYTSFVDYRQYYNNIIAKINIFMKNKTLKSNKNFVVVDEELEQEEWYQRVCSQGTNVVWTYLPHDTFGYDKTLTLTRMVRSKRGKEVGVIAVYLRPEYLEKMLINHGGTLFVLLNGETVISSKGDGVFGDEIIKYLPDNNVEEWQDRIRISGKEYILSVLNVVHKDTTDGIQIVSLRTVQDVIQEASRYNRKTIYIYGLSILFSCCIITTTTHYFSKRVERFYLQMQKAAKGNFELDKELGGSDEISELYDYLGIMIRNIQKLLADIYQERIHAEQLKTKQKDAELMMLTSQINPHFLYNTLETIRMKAVVNRQEEIEELVSMLAKILRSAISAGEKDVPVKSEIELIECYLKIQRYRFGEKLRYHIEVGDGVEQCEIMPLVLQPIVENAIIHGLEGKEEPGYIDIDVSLEDEDIVFSIEDDGIGIEEEKLSAIRDELDSNRIKGEHIGIFNVQYRIRLKYGELYGIKIDSNINSGTRVEIRVPGYRA